ncbi:MAG: triose-phosphate isomerase, partial [Promethearchaeota archaeon]
SLKNVSEEQLTNVIIAYEPVWAIDNKYLNPGIEIKPATPPQAKEAHEIVRTWFKENYSEKAAQEIQIQYGGSMKAANCEDLLKIADIDGGLIGGASLSAEKLIPIIKSAIRLS